MIHPTAVGFYNQAKQQTFCEKITADGSSRQRQVSVAILSIQNKSKLVYRKKMFVLSVNLGKSIIRFLTLRYH